jgi:riboflavin biosynthesis protein RibD
MTGGRHSGDEAYMARALQLARRGEGRTYPNPAVGALVVASGRIISEGWHRGAGQPHAEIVALDRAGAAARGATLYVTLEPCAAAGRTPPCTDAILRAGIRRVVYASRDPNPQMAGGCEVLRSRGIEVTGGVLAADADRINAPFICFHRSGRAYVTAKAAISLDGKLATRSGACRWISGMDSRRHAHRLRARHRAVMVGSGTFEADNPSLTVRHAPLAGEPPLRCVIARITPPFRHDCRLLEGEAPTRFYVQREGDAAAVWRRAGVQVVRVGGLLETLRHLARDGRWPLLLEGGGRTFAAFFEARLIDELVLYQAPFLIGGVNAVGLWHGEGVARLGDAPRLADVTRRRIGDDQLIRGRVVYSN